MGEKVEIGDLLSAMTQLSYEAQCNFVERLDARNDDSEFTTMLQKTVNGLLKTLKR